MRRTTALYFASPIIAAVMLSGCASKEYVNARTDAIQMQMDQQQTRISELDATSQEALKRATAAGKLAEGKFLYSMVLSDDSIKFPADSAKLSPEAEQRLMAFVDKLKSENRNIYLEIQGHTDSRGPVSLNQRLGEERAEAVRIFMNEHGVPLNRMSTISYGKKAPVADNKTREGRSENRRVVLIVMS